MNNIMQILTPVLWFAGIGAVIGVLLAISSKVFAVEVDERVPLIIDALPGANCGGCGYAGCAAFAEAVAKGDAKTNACTVGGAAVAAAVSDIMGVADEKAVRMRAQVMCSGTANFAKKKYIYQGAEDCVTAARLGGGDKICPNSCIGLGTCVRVCPVDAIKTIDGIAVIDFEQCIGCGLCVKTCPKHIIKLIPFNSTHWVGCMSNDKGAVTRKYCGIGCIACRICERVCEFDAVKVIDNLAVIDNDKCTGCNKCLEKCPTHVIWSVKTQRELTLSPAKTGVSEQQ